MDFYNYLHHYIALPLNNMYTEIGQYVHVVSNGYSLYWQLNINCIATVLAFDYLINNSKPL